MRYVVSESRFHLLIGWHLLHLTPVSQTLNDIYSKYAQEVYFMLTENMYSYNIVNICYLLCILCLFQGPDGVIPLTTSEAPDDPTIMDDYEEVCIHTK